MPERKRSIPDAVPIFKLAKRAADRLVEKANNPENYEDPRNADSDYEEARKIYESANKLHNPFSSNDE